MKEKNKYSEFCFFNNTLTLKKRNFLTCSFVQKNIFVN